jgi:hypothetical protein
MGTSSPRRQREEGRTGVSDTNLVSRHHLAMPHACAGLVRDAATDARRSPIPPAWIVNRELAVAAGLMDLI